METIIKTTLIGLFFGTFGTTLGGIIGIKLKRTSNKFLSFILSFASGLMTAIICFELVPEALEIASLPTVISKLANSNFRNNSWNNHNDYM